MGGEVQNISAIYSSNKSTWLQMKFQKNHLVNRSTCSFFLISEILWVGGSTPLIISELSLEAEAVVAGYFYPKDSQGLQNLSQVELMMKELCSI